MGRSPAIHFRMLPVGDAEATGERRLPLAPMDSLTDLTEEIGVRRSRHAKASWSIILATASDMVTRDLRDDDVVDLHACRPPSRIHDNLEAIDQTIIERRDHTVRFSVDKTARIDRHRGAIRPSSSPSAFGRQSGDRSEIIVRHHAATCLVTRKPARACSRMMSACSLSIVISKRWFCFG